MQAQGLLRPQPLYYAAKTAVAVIVMASAMAVALIADQAMVILAAAVVPGFASTQVAMLGHDVGHRQGFRAPQSNKWARFIFGGVLLGVSTSWWTNKHNQHHATPNHLELDPDIQFPMIVFSEEQIATRSRKVAHDHRVPGVRVPLLLPFQAMNMRVASIQYLASARSRRAPRRSA